MKKQDKLPYYVIIRAEAKRKNATITTTSPFKSQDRVPFICNICGSSYAKVATTIKTLDYPCNTCSAKAKNERLRRRVPAMFMERFNRLGLDTTYEVTRIPAIVKEVAEFRHLACGNTIETSLQNLTRTLKSGSSGCKYCSRTHTYTREEVEMFLKTELPIYTLSDLYMSDKSHLTAKVTHKKCGTTKEVMVNVLFRGYGCSKCKSSGAEEVISHTFDNLEVVYDCEVEFDGLFTIGSSKKRRLDFYLPDTKVVIEYDGRHHSELVSVWGGEEYLKHIRLNDDNTNKYLSGIGVSLYRIPHTVIGKELMDVVTDIAVNDGKNSCNYLV